MRLVPVLLPILLCACVAEPSVGERAPADAVTEGPPAQPDPGEGTATTPADDPRFDRSTWPDTLGGDRPAEVFAPADWDGETLLPVVVLLHGYAVGADLQDRIFDLSSRVDSAGFLMILPEGNRDALGLPYWNATPVCCDVFNENPDDEAYLASLLVEVEERFPIDPDRITFTGHSNGGFMSYRMACAFDDKIAAIAPLAGLSWYDPDNCEATTPVSVLHIHGTDDATIPYERNLIYAGAEQTVDRWAERAGCDADLVEQPEPRNYDSFTAGDETIRQHYTGCGDGVQVGLWTMEGSGHLPNLTSEWTDDLVDWLLAQRRVR